MADTDEEVETVANIIIDIVDNEEMDINSSEDLTSKANYKIIQKEFQKTVLNAVNLIANLDRTSFYKNIKKCIEHHENITDDINDAQKTGWHDRRFALESFLEEHGEAVYEKINENRE